MDHSDSSDGSTDEEDVIRNFDKEATKIVQVETLPKKSGDRYMLVYNTYKKWQLDNKRFLSNSEENNLIVYFEELKKRLAPPTLWSIWSMLHCTLSTHDSINIKEFTNLRIIVKKFNKDY